MTLRRSRCARTAATRLYRAIDRSARQRAVYRESAAQAASAEPAGKRSPRKISLKKCARSMRAAPCRCVRSQASPASLSAPSTNMRASSDWKSERYARAAFAPAQGAGARFIRRADKGKPFAAGLKATDPARRAARRRKLRRGREPVARGAGGGRGGTTVRRAQPRHRVEQYRAGESARVPRSAGQGSARTARHPRRGHSDARGRDGAGAGASAGGGGGGHRKSAITDLRIPPSDLGKPEIGRRRPILEDFGRSTFEARFARTSG